MNEESFGHRYGVKLVSSVFIVIINALIQLLLPRALSVEEFGYYSYNLNVFTAVVTMANLSMSSALVSKFSKRNDDFGLVLFYFKFYAVMSIFLGMGVMILYKVGLGGRGFAEQTLISVILGLSSAVLIKLLSDTIWLYDACALAKFPAMVQSLMKVGICTGVIIAYYAGILDLITFYVIQGITTFIAVGLLVYVLFKEKNAAYSKTGDWKTYTKEYFIYCSPLVVATVASQGIIVIMNWVLMRWSGPGEQAMFGIAWQLNAMVAYVFSPFAGMLKREFSVLVENHILLRDCFVSALKRIIWLAAFFAIFLGVEADWILLVLFGENYSAAFTVVVMIMYYTVYQAWGQVCGAFLEAVEMTKLSAFLSILGQVLSLVFVFLFQIPSFIWPDGLGAVGAALNYTVVNFISVTICVYVISKKLKLLPANVLILQLAPIAICSVSAFGVKLLLNNFLCGNDMWVLIGKFVLAGMVYTCIIGMSLWKRPMLIGSSQRQLRTVAIGSFRRLFLGN